MKSKYPLSLRVAFVSLVSTLIFLFAAWQINEAKDLNISTNLTPDSLLPWNGSVAEVEAALNSIYAETGVNHVLVKTRIPGVYDLHLEDQPNGKKVITRMRFVFNDGRLFSYGMEFHENRFKEILASAKFHYKGGSRGAVSTKTREFFIYEKKIPEKNGTIELYGIYDKLYGLIRTQSRFILNSSE